MTTLAPVVVNPDMPSRYASIGLDELLAAVEEVGEGGERRRHEQRRGDDEEPFADADAAPRVRREPLEREPERRS